MFKDQYRAVMQYSLPRDAGKPSDNGSPRLIHHDWICAKCGVQNFRRRDYCFKCNGPKSDADGEGFDEVSTHPTNTVFLRGLDALSTEDPVLNCLMRLTQLPIKSIRIGRDPLTQTSRGVCYVEMNSVVDAMFLHNQLLGEPPTIDDKLASVSYHKSSQQTEERNNTAHSAAASAAMAAAQWSHQGQKANDEQFVNIQAPYSEEDIERLAEYSASTYAKNEVEKAAYLNYYRTFYRDGGTLDGSSNSTNTKLDQPSSSSRNDKGDDLGIVTVDGVEYKRYRTPDVSTYVYDESSGYYYDAISTLYYDANSQYYFNSKTNQYMYWSSEHETFLPAPDNQESLAQDNDKKEDKKDKVKTAKRIAKDMEKWAKTLNQRKEAAKSNQVPANPQCQSGGLTKINIGSSRNAIPDKAGVEDIAFSMLNKRDGHGIATNSQNMQSSVSSCMDQNEEPPPPGSRNLSERAGNASLTGLASYNSDSEGESNGNSKLTRQEDKHTDWEKMACLLCQRQFPSKEKLIKHNQMSELHKQNLEKWRLCSGSLEDANFDVQQYRDRARERRAKYGEADEPKPNKLKEKYMRAMQDVETKALPEKNIGSDNIGSKMLQRMGWKEGLGLGKSNQGRTDIVEAEQRTQKAGLGSSGPLRSNPNDSYKDCVKRTMYQRYHQLDG